MSENEYESDGGGQGGDVVPIQLFNSLGHVQNMTYLHNGHLEEDGTAPMDDGDGRIHNTPIVLTGIMEHKSFCSPSQMTMFLSLVAKITSDYYFVINNL